MSFISKLGSSSWRRLAIGIRRLPYIESWFLAQPRRAGPGPSVDPPGAGHIDNGRGPEMTTEMLPQHGKLGHDAIVLKSCQHASRSAKHPQLANGLVLLLCQVFLQRRDSRTRVLIADGLGVRPPRPVPAVFESYLPPKTRIGLRSHQPTATAAFSGVEKIGLTGTPCLAWTAARFGRRTMRAQRQFGHRLALR